MGTGRRKKASEKFGSIGSNAALSQFVLLALFAIIVIIVAGAAVFGYNFGNTQTNQSVINSLENQLDTLNSKLNSQQSNLTSVQAKLSSLPTENQRPQVRNIKVDWVNTLNSGQDRFFLPTITVNQGDTVAITFVSNDTDAHTFTLESPYDFQINATVPGTLDYLKNETPFTTNATDNSPGVEIFGTPGNVTGTGSFVAKYRGIFEYFCIYHVSLGMFGYLIVLPNEAYLASSSSSNSTTLSGAIAPISIISGSGSNTNSTGFTPSVITVVIGVNNTVEWTNNDSVPHTVTANDGSFSSGNLNPGDDFVWTFANAGNFTYHCSYHSWMKGTVIVKSSSIQDDSGFGYFDFPRKTGLPELANGLSIKPSTLSEILRKRSATCNSYRICRKFLELSFTPDLSLKFDSHFLQQTAGPIRIMIAHYSACSNNLFLTTFMTVLSVKSAHIRDCFDALDR